MYSARMPYFAEMMDYVVSIEYLLSDYDINLNKFLGTIRYVESNREKRERQVMVCYLPFLLISFRL